MTPSHIVLVEDNAADVYLIREALHEHAVAHRMEILTDGKAAIQFFSRPEQAPNPDLIILDLNLPQHDGIEILKMIRSNGGELARVPVAVFTSSDSPRDRDAVHSLGIAHYVRKPSNLDAFLGIGKLIKEILTKE